MSFRRNYLPRQSQSWAREVQSRIQGLEQDLTRDSINNRTRDDQLQASYNRLDLAFVDLASKQSTLEAQQIQINTALEDSTQALQDADDALQEAVDANSNALDALQEIVDLGSPGGPSINASNITAGTIDASDITVTNLDASEITSGSLSADRISGGTISGVTVTSSSGSNTVTLNNGVISISGSGGSGQIRGAGGYNFELFAGSFGDIIVSANSIEGDWANFAQFGAGGSKFNGENFPGVASNNQSTFAANVFLNSSGEMFRDPTISSREAKENIEQYTFDTEAFISVNPVTFEYKEEAFPQLTGEKHLGFILEDFEEAGLGEHLSIPANEIDKYKGLRYDKLYMFLHKTVQELNERIKALENG